MKKLLLLLCLATPGLLLAQETESTPQNQKETFQPDIRGDLMFRIGFNALTDAPEDFKLNAWGSKSVHLRYFYDLPFGNSGISFRPGFGLGLEKYEFDNPRTLTYRDEVPGFVSTEPILVLDTLTSVWGEGTFKKSKLAANYVDIPLEFQYASNASNPKSGFSAAIGGSIGVLYGAHTKVKFEADNEMQKRKVERKFNLSPFRYSAHTRIGVGGFNLYFEYQLSDFFENGEGPLHRSEESEGEYVAFPEVSNWRVGLSISLF